MENFPAQPIEKAADGVIRFRQNRLVRKFMDMASAGQKFDLNDAYIWCQREGISIEERMQLSMLSGYSVSGFGDLYSEVAPDEVAAADAIADAIISGP